MYSLIVDTEDILKSRPLIPLSSDSNDLSALSPGHFYGEPLTSSVRVDLTFLQINRPRRQQRKKQLHQQLKTNYQSKVIGQFQTRSKGR